MLSSHGLVIPARVDQPRIRVTPLHLRVMALLSLEPDERSTDAPWLTEAEGSDVDSLLADLERRGFLVAERPSAPQRVEAAVSRPSSAAATGRVRVVAPIVLHPTRGVFHLVDGSGAVVGGWEPDEVVALERYRHAVDVDGEPGAAKLLAPLVGTPWLIEAGVDDDRSAMEITVDRVRRDELARTHRFVTVSERQLDQLVADDTSVVRSGGASRVPVYPVSNPVQYPNTALGLILAYAQQYQGGRLGEHYDLTPFWNVRRSTVRRLLEERGPAVFLFSSYLWSSAANLALSKLVKEISPESLTIHGGPDVPRYERDVEDYLRRHPHVDVVGRNEGEATVAEVLDAVAGRLDDRVKERLREVPGIAFLDGDEVVRTADRDRFSDLDQLPSPFLTGVFATFEEVTAPMVILETNRGCPYGCTFCDWGSATASRIRQFSLERVLAELDWTAAHRIERVSLADANFGILARDVEIAEHVAFLHQTTGYPKYFHTSYAKNTIKHLDKIIEVLVDSGLTTAGCLSLQTVDPETLATIDRTNIKTEKYLELAATFRRKRLPLFTELMVGLPGSTFESFLGDLQFTVDHEVPARVHRTELLVNTPMNDPTYRTEHRIEVAEGEMREISGVVRTRRQSLVVSSATFSREDLERSLDLRAVYSLCENYGVLRHVARYVRQTAGIREIDLYWTLRERVRGDRDDYPCIRWAFETMDDMAVPPVSWAWFYDEVRHYLVQEIGVADDSALATVLAVQRALVPDRGRSFPCTLDLDHDYADWFERHLLAKEAGRDWVTEVPPLRSFDAATFTVEDPRDVCGHGLGRTMEVSFSNEWELRSPVSRPVTEGYFAV